MPTPLAKPVHNCPKLSRRTLLTGHSTCVRDQNCMTYSDLGDVRLACALDTLTHSRCSGTYEVAQQQTHKPTANPHMRPVNYIILGQY